MAKGFLVSKEWVRGVEEALRTLGASQLEKGQAVGGLFYELRPAVLASAWTQNAAGLYVATAQFVVNDTVDSSFTFDVCAPTASDDPGGTVGTTRFFVVWRGRWEMVAGTGLTIEQVDAEIWRILTNSIVIRTLNNGYQFAKDADGYLTFVPASTATLRYYGVE